MPYKDKDKRAQHAKEYGAEWYQRNRNKVLERTRKRKKEKREEWHRYKAGLSCLFCGQSHPAIIDFHHPDAKGEKKVSEYCNSGQWKRAYIEAGKCEILCANCHRILHWMEKEGEKVE